LRHQEVKMDFFWLSRLLVSPSMSLGFLRKVWMPGSITVEAKSGRVSRSRNWEIDSAEPMNSPPFSWRRVQECGVGERAGGGGEGRGVAGGGELGVRVGRADELDRLLLEAGVGAGV